MEIHEAVIELLKSPYLSFLPQHNREDIVATITCSMISVAREANPNLYINDLQVKKLVLKLYDDAFPDNKPQISASKEKYVAQLAKMVDEGLISSEEAEVSMIEFYRHMI